MILILIQPTSSLRAKRSKRALCSQTTMSSFNALACDSMNNVPTQQGDGHVTAIEEA